MAFDDELRDALRARAEQVQVSADARSRLADAAVRAEKRRRRRIVTGVAAAAVVAVAAGTVGALQLRDDGNQLVADGGQAATESAAVGAPLPKFVLDVPDGWVLEAVSTEHALDGWSPYQETHQVFRRDAELATLADPGAPAIDIRTTREPILIAGPPSRTVRVRRTDGVSSGEGNRASDVVYVTWTEDDVNRMASAVNLSEAELVAWLDAGSFADGAFRPGTAEPTLVETVNLRGQVPGLDVHYRGPVDPTEPTGPSLRLTVSLGSGGLAAAAPIGAEVAIVQVGDAPGLVWSHHDTQEPQLTVKWESDGALLGLQATAVDRDVALGFAAQVRQVDEAEWEQFVATAEYQTTDAPGGGEIVAGPEPLATGTTPDAEWRMERTVYADGTECRSLAIGGHDYGESCSSPDAIGPSIETSEPFVMFSHGEAGGLAYLTTNVAADVTRVVAELDDGATVEVTPAAGTDGRYYVVLQYQADRVVDRLVAYRADGSEAASVHRPIGGPLVTFDPELRGTPIASGEVDGAPWTVEATQAPTTTGELVDCARVEFAGQPQPWCPAAMEPDAGDVGAESVAVRDRRFLVAWSPDAATVRVTYDGGEILSAAFGRAPDAAFGFAVVPVDFGDGTPAAIELLASDGQVLDAIDPATAGGFDAPPPVPDPGLVDPEAESHG